MGGEREDGMEEGDGDITFKIYHKTEGIYGNSNDNFAYILTDNSETLNLKTRNLALMHIL